MPPIERRLRLAALALLGGAVAYLACEAIAASAWTDPPYSYLANWVSDLGVRGPVTFLGHRVASPLWWVFSLGLVIEALAFATAGLLLARAVGERRARVFLVAVAAQATGALMVAAFPETPATGPHFIGAILAIAGGNVAAFFSARALAPVLPRRLRYASRALGLAGLATFTALVTFGAAMRPVLAVAGGLLERVAIGTVIVWALAVGVALLRREPPRA